MYPPQRYYLTNLGDRSTVKELPSRLGMTTDEFVAKQIRELLLRFCMGWTISFSSNFETRPKVLSKSPIKESSRKLSNEADDDQNPKEVRLLLRRIHQP